MKCSVCGGPVIAQNDYRLVTGWERIHRTAGGTNAIRAPKRTDVFACRTCVEKMVRNINAGQETLAV